MIFRLLLLSYALILISLALSSVVYYMEYKSITELTDLFEKTYKCFEMFNDIIRITTISRVLMNIYQNKTIRSDEVYADRLTAYSDSLISTINDLMTLVDKYGNMGKFSSEFQSTYGYIMLLEVKNTQFDNSINNEYDELIQNIVKM